MLTMPLLAAGALMPGCRFRPVTVVVPRVLVAELPVQVDEAGLDAGHGPAHLPVLPVQPVEVEALAGHLLRGRLHEDALAGLALQDAVRLKPGDSRPHR